uniref:hypothetical protein n=1 Tax=Trichocoleus desertorum TaxID=1481672 RepID=UPI0025B49508
MIGVAAVVVDEVSELHFEKRLEDWRGCGEELVLRAANAWFATKFSWNGWLLDAPLELWATWVEADKPDSGAGVGE